ncbi:MAG: DinB family protein [Cyclobacteriaceae bacterium]
MKDFFKDIFEYHFRINQRLIEQLIEIENILPDRTLSLISHSINAQQIWNARITNKDKLGVHQKHTLQECKRLDQDNYSETLHILDNYELDKKLTYTTSKGIVFNSSIQQILYHIANHFSHHRGQIVSDIRQSGIDPIITDYIFYKR